jgi:UTP:GlnB (protein PII) uridylyltransferase
VETDDQPGVLRRITLAFAVCDTEIELARLMTEGPRVLDIFYVSRLDDRAKAVLARQVQEYLRRRVP